MYTELACTIADPIASLLDLQNRYSPLRLTAAYDFLWGRGDGVLRLLAV
jgi:hypothetical protein